MNQAGVLPRKQLLSFRNIVVIGVLLTVIIGGALATAVPGGGVVRIAILDDNRVVLEATADLLSLLGVDIDKALHCGQLESWLVGGRRYALFVVDQESSLGLNGDECIEQVIRRYQPEAQIILASSSDQNDLVARLKVDFFHKLMNKPDVLVEMVRRAIGLP